MILCNKNEICNRKRNIFPAALWYNHIIAVIVIFLNNGVLSSTNKKHIFKSIYTTWSCWCHVLHSDYISIYPYKIVPVNGTKYSHIIIILYLQVNNSYNNMWTHIVSFWDTHYMHPKTLTKIPIDSALM